MANRDDYRELLGERFEKAYKAKNESKRPSEIEIAKWKHLAGIRRKEKRRKVKIAASLASVFTMVFCFSVVSLFQLPDAQAGEDQIVDIKDSRDDEEMMIVDNYFDYEEVPLDVREEFFIVEDLPEGYEFSEMKVVTIGRNKRCESKFKNGEGEAFVVKERKLAEGETKIRTIESEMENWYGIDVYIKRYTNREEKTTYRFIVENSFVNIVSDIEVEKEVIKKVVKEAI